MAGMSLAVKYSDLIITIDADLQDDVNVIPKMIQKYQAGYDVVYGVRNNRQTDTFFKRRTALAFYGLMRYLGVNLVADAADYRLLSKRAVESLLAFKERNLFLRGLVPLVGYRSGKVYYARQKRYAGSSKYSLGKMLHLALNGIISFSAVPLHLIMDLGLLIVVICIIWLFCTIFNKGLGQVARTWTSLMISIWLIGGIQLAALGIIGEYVGRTNIEVKRRPRFIIEKETYTKKMK